MKIENSKPSGSGRKAEQYRWALRRMTRTTTERLKKQELHLEAFRHIFLSPTTQWSCSCPECRRWDPPGRAVIARWPAATVDLIKLQGVYFKIRFSRFLPNMDSNIFQPNYEAIFRRSRRALWVKYIHWRPKPMYFHWGLQLILH